MKDPRDRLLLISKIADKAIKAWNAESFNNFQKLDVMMDVEYADADCPMDLQKLLDFPDSDFFHDMAGINRHFNRETKKLEDSFVPRCSLPEVPCLPLSGL